MLRLAAWSTASKSVSISVAYLSVVWHGMDGVALYGVLFTILLSSIPF